MTGIGGVIDPVDQQGIVDVNPDNLAKYDPCIDFLTACIFKLKDLSGFALKGDFALLDSWHTDLG